MAASRRTFLGAALAATATIATPRRASADPSTIRLIYFPSADMLPVWIGLGNGFFTRENVALALTPTPGSVYQFQHLSAGDFDVALTAIDNAIAYDEGQGEAPLANPADFAAFLGGDSAFLRLYVRPEITSYADLKGKMLPVDALTTGFAFVLRAMLAKHGLGDGDYTLVPLGGTPARYSALLGGQGAGTILNAPFDLLAAAQGMKKLDDVVPVIGPYQGGVSVARRSWLNGHLDAAAGYVRGMLASLRWMYDPANRAACVQLLIDNAKLSPAIAAAMYPVLTDPQSGMARDGMLDIQGVRTVLALRTRYGMPQKVLGNPNSYFDERPMAIARSRG
jgi:ABC-type nitrate/sulfonate/bicarbonate transport system substrate-binding protein